MKKIWIMIAGAIAVSCGEKKSDGPRAIEKASWLIGSWENASAEGTMSETWTRENDSVFSGQAFYISSKNDTLHSETIALNESEGTLIYTPIVRGQNNDKPVTFKLTSSAADKLVFENPQHDFPNKIIYNKVTEDSIVAEISGVQQGRQSSEKFPMRRK